MRSMRLAAVAVSVAMLAACAGGSRGFAPIANGFVRRAPDGVGPGPRGSIVRMWRVTTFTKYQLNGGLGLAGQVISALGGAPKCEVSEYGMVFRTIGVRGEPATASGGFFVPGKGCSGPFTLVGYGQGTNVNRAMKITSPSKVNIQPAVLAAIFAAHGYPLVSTDYLGLGYSSYSYQPYLVVSAEASAVIDSLRAARNAAARLKVALNGNVFLTGHSQGGQTALGTQKVIEAQDAGEFHLFADSPSSGPYALSETMLDGLRHPGQSAPIFTAYALTGYNKVYRNVYRRAIQVFQLPYARYVDTLLPVKTYAAASLLAGKTLPLALRKLMQPAFLRQFADNPNSPARVDLALNDLLDGWTPVAPVYFCGGSKDPEVEFKNSRLAYAYFKARGATVSLLDVNPFMPPTIPITEYHVAVLVLCHTIERVNILDAQSGAVHLGRWPANAHGQLWPTQALPQL